MHKLTIDRPWGTHLRHWLSQSANFALLDRLSTDDTQLESWHHGGCRVLACAIKAALARPSYPGYVTLKIVASNESPVDHVVVKATNTQHDIWYVDADGDAREPTMLRRFAHRENRTGLTLIDYDEELLDRYEIQCPQYKLARLTKALLQVMNKW